MSIRYKDILPKLKAIGVSTYWLRKARILTPSTVTRIRENRPISTQAIDIICNLLHCQPNDIMEIEYDRLPEECSNMDIATLMKMEFSDGMSAYDKIYSELKR